jgi:DNA-directed RNA polymerase subunit H (RpoH/RPB5)
MENPFGKYDLGKEYRAWCEEDSLNCEIAYHLWLEAHVVMLREEKERLYEMLKQKPEDHPFGSPYDI